MAVAEASFKTVNVSISPGLMVFSGFLIPEISSLSIGTPSITKSGSLLAESDEPPRMRMVEPEPGAPPPEVIWTPGILPITSCSGEVMEPLLKSSALTAVTDPVASSFLTCPYPITTTSSNCSVSIFNATFNVVCSSTTNSVVSYPMYEN